MSGIWEVRGFSFGQDIGLPQALQQMLGYYLEINRDYFLLGRFKFTRHNYPSMSFLTTATIDMASLNSPHSMH
jgi:hypothetical protein